MFRSVSYSGVLAIFLYAFRLSGHLTNLPREHKINGSYNSLFETAGESFYVQTHARIGVLIQSQLQIENGQLTTDYVKKFQNLGRDLCGSSNQNFSRRNETGFSAGDSENFSYSFYGTLISCAIL